MSSYPPGGEAKRSVFNRRTALKLAAGAVPVAASFMVPGLGNVASASAALVKPSASNTGVPVGTPLRTHTGDIVVTTPGTVLDSLDIRGFVKIRAANVVVRRCRVRGSGPGTTNTGLIDCNHTNVRNAVIEDCLLKPDYPSVWLTGVIGKEYTARRCNVYNVVDGFGAYNVSNRSAPTNVSIIGNYIHDLSYFSRDRNHANGPTHNDGIQIQGGANVRIEGNNIQTFMSQSAGTQNYPYRNCGQGILAQWNLAPITGSAIINNWLGGGDAGIYFVSATAMRFGTVSGNRFERTQHDFGGGSSYQIRSKRTVTFSNALSSNVWADTGVSFYSGKYGGIRYDG